MRTGSARMGVWLIERYQVVSPLFASISVVWGGSGGCRYEPSCSEYAKQAINRYGIISGVWLAIQRIIRCRPGCEGGLDPVPDEA